MVSVRRLLQILLGFNALHGAEALVPLVEDLYMPPSALVLPTIIFITEE